MAVLLPTSENIRLLKSILMGDFEMRSAHATEAIAALIGFSSNTSFSTTSNHLPDVTVYDVNFDAFESRAAQLGYDRTSSEYLRFIYKGIDWPEPVWRHFKKRDSAARDAWFYECERRKIPFLHIAKATKYCTVYWDHMSLDSEYDQKVRQSADGKIGRVMFRTYQLIVSGLEPRSFFEGSGLVGQVTGLSESSARQIADAIAILIFPGNLELATAA